MTREEALTRIEELSCPYKHVRMTECPHCATEVEALIRALADVSTVAYRRAGEGT